MLILGPSYPNSLVNSRWALSKSLLKVNNWQLNTAFKRREFFPFPIRRKLIKLMNIILSKKNIREHEFCFSKTYTEHRRTTKVTFLTIVRGKLLWGKSWRCSFSPCLWGVLEKGLPKAPKIQRVKLPCCLPCVKAATMKGLDAECHRIPKLLHLEEM